MTLNDTFPQKLKRLRQQRNLSQEAFAECCGISERYLRKLESGESSPTLQVIDKICCGLDIGSSFLLETDASESYTG